MPKFDKFEIKYSNPDGVYQPGQMLEGTVTIDTPEKLTVKCVRVEFKGKTETEWDEGTFLNSDSYSAEEVHFKQSEVLFGKDPKVSKDTTELYQGQHNFPFRFQLPSPLPNTFEGKYGKVKYRVLVIVERPMDLDKEEKEEFIIANRPALDLNTVDDAMKPIQLEETKTMCCLCCRAGTLTASLKLPRTGYTAGETIVINADIQNMSTNDIKGSAVVLMQKVVYSGKSMCFKSTKSKEQEVARLARPAFKARGSDYWRDEKLEIPEDLPVSGFPDCKYIDIQYVLALVVFVDGWSFDLMVQTPIIIGDQPHNQVGPTVTTASTADPGTEIDTAAILKSITVARTEGASATPGGDVDGNTYGFQYTDWTKK